MKRFRYLAVFVALGILGSMLCIDAEAQAPKRKLLYFTKSSGYEHSVVKREADRLAHSEKIMAELGAQNGYDVVCTKDGGQINANNLAKYDAVAFYTSGDLVGESGDGHPQITEQGLNDLFAWIKAGGGFSAWHAGTDSLRRKSPDDPSTEYTKLVGGAFAGHHKQEPATVIVTDPKFPGMTRMPLTFRFNEEWYIHDQVNAGGTMRVLQILDTQSMKQEKYRTLKPYPITWCSQYGKGRVFVSAIGHREDVWEMPVIQGMIVDALAWTFGDVEGDASPNYDEVMKAYK